MKGLFVFLIFILLNSIPADAIGGKHKYSGLPRTEVELMDRVLECLKNKDTISYFNLFPPFDTLWGMVNHNADQSPEAIKELNQLKEHPTVLIDLDPYYNHAIIGRFAQALGKGEDSGLNWKGIIMQRFELQKQGITRGMEGLQRIAPERFKGYLFVRDMLSSTTYCITITEIQKIKGFYFGGQVLNVLEASDIDQYLAREAAERKHVAKIKQQSDDRQKNDTVKKVKISAITMAASIDTTSDSFIIARYLADSTREALTKGATTKDGDTIPQLPVDTAKIRRDKLLLSSPSADDDPSKMRHEVVDRRFYKGKLDDEIPIELYVRYMKDVKGKVSGWDGLYKFGDMQQYIKLDITKPDDKWLFEEPAGTMELELSGKTYTGSWTSGENLTGYDAELTQKEISQKKIETLDKILENGSWGKTDKQKIIEKANKPAKKAEASDKDKAKEEGTDTDKEDKKKESADKKDKKDKKKADTEKKRKDDDEDTGTKKDAKTDKETPKDEDED